MAQLNHPSILKLVGYSPINFKEKPKPVIIIEYAPKGSLKNMINLEIKSKSPTEWNDTKKLINLYGICSAMAYLHSHKIIHRDLKPDNILEDEFLFPKIADFGISKALHTNTNSMSSRITEKIKGTIEYVAPEVFINQVYSNKSDVYSFGILAYELLTLSVPFEVNDMHRHVILPTNVSNGERPVFKKPIPDCYLNLIKECWDQNPELRPTFEQIKQRLRTNKEFITPTVDKDQFFEYVEMIDNSLVSFDHNKKFQKVLLSKSDNTKTGDTKNDDTKTGDTKSDDTKTDDTKSDDTTIVKEVIIERMKDVDLGYEYSPDKSIRYKLTADQERRIVRDSKSGNEIEVSEWKNCSDIRKTEAGRLREEIEYRQKKYLRKEVETHAEPHSLLGLSSVYHTHFKVFHVTRTQQRTIKTDYDGNLTVSDWVDVPGSEIKIFKEECVEKGFLETYEVEIPQLPFFKLMSGFF